MTDAVAAQSVIQFGLATATAVNRHPQESVWSASLPSLKGDPDQTLGQPAACNHKNHIPHPMNYCDKPAAKFKTPEQCTGGGGGGYNELRIEDKHGRKEQIYPACPAATGTRPSRTTRRSASARTP